MKPSDKLWEPKRRIELTFRRSLMELARQITKRIKNKKDPDEIRRVLFKMAETKSFRQFCESMAMKMVTGLFSDQGHTWRQAARANSKSRIIYTALQKELKGPTGQIIRRLVHENSKLIRTLPKDIAEEVAKYTARESLKGRRASDIAKEIQHMFPKHTRARAELIARTQTSKTTTELTEARCQQFGIDWYIWRPVGGSQGDGRTRSSHRRMSGVLVSWKDPPAPEDLFPVYGKNGKRYKNTLGHYHAGCCPNCRCYPEPILDLDSITWPVKVYIGGRIHTVNRKNFERMM